jgi:hypothetical protein
MTNATTMNASNTATTIEVTGLMAQELTGFRLPPSAFRQQNQPFDRTTAYWLFSSDSGQRMAFLILRS